jgi:hypothetical protein
MHVQQTLKRIPGREFPPLKDPPAQPRLEDSWNTGRPATPAPH